MKENEIPKNYQPLEGSERRPAPGAKYLGPADAKEIIRVTIALRRRPDGPPIPGFDYYARTAPKDRPRLSPEEFAAKYGADTTDIARVVEFAEGQGLTIVEVNAGRRTVVVSGTVAQFSKAFALSLGQYEHAVVRNRNEEAKKERYRGRDGLIHIPRELAGIIVGVFGLDNRRITKRNMADPPNTVLLPVRSVTGVYHFPGNSAAGQTIAIFSEGGYQTPDINAYFGSIGMAVPTLTDVSVDAGNGGFADPETTQDICIAATAAPGAAIATYFTTYSQAGWFDLVSRVIHPTGGDPVCSVLSSSFYVSNGDDLATLASEGVSVSWLNAVHLAFQDAAIQAVTICIASGDTGTQSKKADGKAHVQYPGSDPWVLSVGGTTVGNVVGTTADEYVWNDGSGATGGGVSDFFALPPYQTGVGVPGSLNDGHAGRGVPDVAANGSGNSGYPMIAGGGPFTGGGTSASAPLWAGLIAVLNAAIGASVGFINPSIYVLGSPVFRDIVAEPGAVDNSFAGVAGYPARLGWDACTGWGSPNGRRLLAGLAHEPVVVTATAAGGNFGSVCRGVYKDLLLTINNAALPNPGGVSLASLGLLSITNITSSSPDFLAPDVAAYPMLVSAGASVEVVIRMRALSFGLKTATIRIFSNDPASPHLVQVSGLCEAPRLNLAIADGGNFGKTCVGSFKDEPLVLNNSGSCVLTVNGITSSSAEFLAPGVHSYPMTIAPGNSMALPIRFAPAGFGSKTAVITVDSDDPAGARAVRVSGVAPSGKLTVTGSTYFGGVRACCREEKLISICNVGDCALNVTGVAFKRKSPHWKLINNPFPATLHPGSCLAVVIVYKASEKCPRACELIITSDDPATPMKCLDVMAYTIWNECRCEGKCSCGCEQRDCDPCGCEEHEESDEEC